MVCYFDATNRRGGRFIKPVDDDVTWSAFLLQLTFEEELDQPITRVVRALLVCCIGTLEIVSIVRSPM